MTRGSRSGSQGSRSRSQRRKGQPAPSSRCWGVHGGCSGTAKAASSTLTSPRPPKRGPRRHRSASDRRPSPTYFMRRGSSIFRGACGSVSDSRRRLDPSGKCHGLIFVTRSSQRPSPQSLGLNAGCKTSHFGPRFFDDSPASRSRSTTSFRTSASAHQGTGPRARSRPW